jgi:peptidyl-tRNA hydrolase, PTH1 family
LKYLVVGLGNPGAEYVHTRHNIGFEIADFLATEAGSFFQTDKHADVTKIKVKGRVVVLVKPTTFMNLSGKAVNYWLQKEKILPSNLLVIADDIALPEGDIRVRGKGGDGGHNGLADVNQVLGSGKYARLRFGVGSDFSRGRQADYVLDRWPEDQKEMIADRIKIAADAVKSFVSIGLSQTMNRYNNK